MYIHMYHVGKGSKMGFLEVSNVRMKRNLFRKKSFLGSRRRAAQGCQISLGTIYQNVKIPNNYKNYQITIKITKWPYNLQNGLKICQMNHKTYIQTIFISRSHQMYPNWDFWYETGWQPWASSWKKAKNKFVRKKKFFLVSVLKTSPGTKVHERLFKVT
jgi:uncharacterized protein YeaC (DUF1315 family)